MLKWKLRVEHGGIRNGNRPARTAELQTRPWRTSRFQLLEVPTNFLVDAVFPSSSALDALGQNSRDLEEAFFFHLVPVNIG